MKYVLAWFPLVFIAIVNGAIREGWYGKHLSELQAHQISTITGVLLFGVYIWVLMLKGCTKMVLTPLRAASNLPLQASGTR